MNITIGVSKKEILQAIKQANKFANKVNKSLDKLSEQIEEVALKELTERTNEAMSSQYIIEDEVNQPICEKTMDGKELKFIWSGRSVKFLEFGTGTRGQAEPYEKAADFNWTYNVPTKYKKISKSRGQLYWVHNKIQTYGLPAYAPVLKTAHAMRREIPELIRKNLRKIGDK